MKLTDQRFKNVLELLNVVLLQINWKYKAYKNSNYLLYFISLVQEPGTICPGLRAQEASAFSRMMANQG